ncbi:hypothetical protein HYPSUDRAFT_208124 [Hypholoma sublateritium FD-334 SS-4]|uniref:N-acetyltransferase domain-containing protein n=1 Tax=Hypholoma sublateritium (strain FD-334 SS-4) TaxID=945553 RepID=A0A0D2N7R0_HYPSF|nr:hypothetical protein HYPSUDRAFT_208124 [Hypholoma sublateritium FD-334 SS-4]
MASISYRAYRGDADLPHIMALVESELSEPYVVYTFRYFLHQWPHLAFLAFPPDAPVGAPPIGVIVCKQSVHRDLANRGYIAMLSVDRQWRKRGIASALVGRSIQAMKRERVDEVRPPSLPPLPPLTPQQIVLETEHDNAAALALYESLGFIREKRLHRFYLNGKDAFRLVLAVPDTAPGSDSPDSSAYASDGTPPAQPGRFFAHRRREASHRAICVSPYSDDDDDEPSAR